MQAPQDEIRVLHIDDEPDFAEMAATFLEREDDRFVVEPVTSASDGLKLLSGDDVDCVVSDYSMPERNGIELLEAVRDDYPELPFILYTGKGSEEVAGDAISTGVTDYLQKGTGTSQYEVLANRIQNAVEQHRTQTELEDRESRLNLFFEQSPLGVIKWDEEFNVIQINPAAEDILGYDQSDLVGESWETLVPESERDEVEAIARRLRETKGWYDYVNENVRKDGDRIICEWHNRVVTDEDDEILTIVSKFQDVTERRQQERRLNTLIDNLPGMVYRCQNERGWPMDSVRGEVETLTGYTRSELEASDDLYGTDIVHPDDQEDVWNDVQTALDAGERFEISYRIRTKDGTPKWVWERGQGIYADDGTVEALEGFITDITDQRQYEQKLKQQIARLEEFADIVSHDLRNPLNVAQGRLALAQDDCDSDHLDSAVDAIERGLGLIDELLRLAREGEELGEREAVDLADVVEECWETVDTAEATLVTDTRQTINADRSRLRQLLANLIRNAVEYGGDDVTVTVGEVDDGFCVEDDGPGIPEDDRERVFETGYSSRSSGAGLGLAIVTQIVDAHDWDIRVEDSEAGGTRFEITGVT